MARRRKPTLVDIVTAGFALDEPLRLWLLENYPTVDAEKTVALFTDKALAKGWVYADWSAAFRNYMSRAKEWGGVAYKANMSPEAVALIEEAKALGFRMPRRGEKISHYRDALKAFDKQSASQQHGLLDSLPIKRIPK